MEGFKAVKANPKVENIVLKLCKLELSFSEENLGMIHEEMD